MNAQTRLDASVFDSERVISRYREAVREDECPSLDSVLRDLGPHSPEVLLTLAALEFEHRLAKGEHVTAVDYLTRFPTLQANPESAVKLVAVEFQAARSRDPKINESKFRERYPELAIRPEWSNGPWVGLVEQTPTGEHKRFPYDLLAAPQAADEIGRLGNYRILGILGEGGMGVVLKAEEISLSRPVALKLMKPEQAASSSARTRFQREARTAAAVEHPRIVIIYAVGEVQGVPFIAMPLMKGQSLAARLEKPMPLNEAVRFGREMAEGLAAAHERGLIHRDIKPENVWLEETAEGVHVRLLDFGLVSGSNGENLTQSHSVMGTPAYMAPEQAKGLTVDSRADLFSLGCTLYQMTTGKKAFTGPNVTAILSAVLTEQPSSAITLNPTMPAELSTLIDRLLSKDPDGRPSNVGEVVAVLRAIESNVKGDASTVSRIEYPHARVLANAATGSELANAATGESARVLANAATGSSRRWAIAGMGVALALIVVVGMWQATKARTSVVNVAAPPTEVVTEFRIASVELPQHRPLGMDMFQEIGVLGKDSFVASLHDRVRVTAALSKPGYGYILAFRPDGVMDLCTPVDANEKPVLRDAIEYHPTDRNTAYGLDEGTGLWVFAVVASEQELPPFQEWKKNLGKEPNWKGTLTLPGTIWKDDGVWVEATTAEGRKTAKRGLNERLDGPEQRLKTITDWLLAAGADDGVKVMTIGFGVVPSK